MNSVYSVGQINAYIHNMFSQDFLLGRVCVRGEISNLKYHTSGHIYFTLKDASAAISAVMFAGNRKGLRFRLENGQTVIAIGSIGVYEKNGTYQLYTSAIRLDGLGELYERYEALKKELAQMGMFDPSYKKPIPKYIRTLGVVTAPTGAAVRDIIQISRRRNPGIRIILYPARVQGEGAAESIVRGIQTLDRAGVDTMIIGRGGGSIEDLWAFNEEITARAVFNCSVPVISAVGHETDTVITDYVADLRAPTPSAAAELAVCDVRQLLLTFGQYREKLDSLMRQKVKDESDRAQRYQLKLQTLSPQQQLSRLRLNLNACAERLDGAMKSHIDAARQRLERQQMLLSQQMREKLDDERHQVSLYREKLMGLSPYEKLKQGYALVTDPEGKRITSVTQISSGDELNLFLSDGQAQAIAKQVAVHGSADQGACPVRNDSQRE